ncbi:MAG: hypothetical protein KJP00_11065, partial [Bacteroidia bacterium]|nr:hypothetical protein [Bacteroidia bacterium]
SEADSIAAIYLDTAMTLNDQLAEAYTLKGAILPSDQEEEIEAAFLKAIELNPNYERAYHWYAVNTNNLEKRDSLISLALNINPLSPVLLINKANYTRYYDKDYNEAKRLYEKIISIEPKYEQAYERLASLLRHEYGMLDSAAIYNYKGVQALGTFVMREDYIETLTELGLFEEALEELNAYDLTNPQHAISAKFAEATIAERSGDFGSLEPRLREFAQLMISIGNTAVSEELILAQYAYIKRDYETFLQYNQQYRPELLDTKKEQKIDFTITDPFLVIHTLLELERNDEAEALLEHYAYLPDSIQTTMGLYDDWNEIFEVFYTILNGDHEQAIDLLEASIEKKHYIPIIRFKDHPILDLLREQPRFMAVANEIESIQKEQAQNFRNYLRGPD